MWNPKSGWSEISSSDLSPGTRVTGVLGIVVNSSRSPKGCQKRRDFFPPVPGS